MFNDSFSKRYDVWAPDATETCNMAHIIARPYGVRVRIVPLCFGRVWAGRLTNQ